MCYFKYFDLLFCYLYIIPTNQGGNNDLISGGKMQKQP